MNSDARRAGTVPLYVKVSGPGATPIPVLVERGEAAAKRVSEEYSDYALMLVARIVITGKIFLQKQASIAEWNSLYSSVRDLRTSGASAGHHHLAAICSSLETVWTTCHRNDARLPKVVDLHLDALTLTIVEAFSETTCQRLHQELRSAASILDLGEGYVSP